MKKFIPLSVIAAALFVVILAVYLFAYFHARPKRLRSHDLIQYGGAMKRSYEAHYPVPYNRLRDYETVYFTGEPFTDSITFVYARLRVYTLLHQRDTVHGIHFSFGDNCTYTHLIRTLDVLIGERAASFIFDKGELWFVVLPRED
jgi:hypothetical protein